MLGVVGATASETSVAEETVRGTGVEATDPVVAVMFVVPMAADVASPLEPVLVIVAVAGVLESQTTSLVKSWVL